MAQACDGYTRSSLMGNWYEERLAPEQPFRENLNDKTNRDQEAAISFPSDNNQLIPLSRIKRNQPWVTKGVLADDGFQEFRSENSTAIDPINLQNYYKIGDQRPLIKTRGHKVEYPENSQNHIQTYKTNSYKLINEDNLQHIKEERRVPQNVTDFGSTFQKHEETHKKLFGITAYQHSFSRPIPTTAQEIIKNHELSKNSYAGNNERPVDQQCLKSISTLTGEKYKDLYDPKDNTKVQRSWLPYEDKALLAAENNLSKNATLNKQTGFLPQDPMQTYKNNNKQVLQHDIATSLPIGDGDHSLHPTYSNPGAHRHIRTDITMVKNKPITKR